MTIPRAAARAWGVEWPPDVAAVETRGGRHRRVTTWPELMARRRARQAEELARRRRLDEPDWRPCFVWAFEIPSSWDWYPGWWCYLGLHSGRVDSDGRPWVETIDVRGKHGDRADLVGDLMREIPLGVLPDPRYFESWMQELARRYPRRHPADKRRAGSVVGWVYQRRAFRLRRGSPSLDTGRGILLRPAAK